MSMPIKLFLVDDDPDDQEIFTMAVTGTQIPVDLTYGNDGMDALEIFQNNPSFQPDFIFIDINMPRMNGIEFLRHLKQTTYAPESCIVMYSTSLDDSIIENARQLCAQQFVIKPPRLNQLIDELKRILQPSN